MAQIVSIVKEAENARLKRMYADIVIQNELVKKTLQKISRPSF